MSEAADGRGGFGWVAGAALAALLLIPLSTAWGMAPDLGHGWAAPLLVAYLYWERWKTRPRSDRVGVPGAGWLALLAAGLLALPLRLLLIPFPLWTGALWAYTALLAGLGLAAAGLASGPAGLRWWGGPLIVLAGALPWPTQVDQWLVHPLRLGMAALTAEASNLLGHPAIAAGTGLAFANGWVAVDEACGGIRSLQAAVMAALFLGEWLEFRWPRRLALSLAAVLAALAGNFGRILFLSLRADESHEAMVAVHDAAGWAALLATLAVVGGLAWLWRRHGRGAPAKGVAPRTAPMRSGAAAWLALAAGLVAADEGAARWWFDRHEVATAAPQWSARLPEGEPGFHREPLSEEARALLLPDSYVAGHWRAGPEQTRAAYYIEWHGGQAARFVPFLHNPTVCLPLAGCELVRSLGTVPARWVGGQLPFEGYLFRQGGQDLAVAFLAWDTARGRPLAQPEAHSTWLERLGARWDEVREARRNQPAQLLSIAVSGRGAAEDLAAAVEALISP